MTHPYGFLTDAMMLTIEANKENIPPGIKIEEPFILPESRSSRGLPDDHDIIDSPVPRPSPAMSQLSDTSFISSSQDSLTMTNSADEADEEIENSSRKEKSLGLLCQRFLVAMNEETINSENNEVHLETVARKMTVEKRRIYDIVNVMEALDAMQKTNKSYYKWRGLKYLPKLMLELQRESIDEGLPQRVLRVEQAMCNFTELSSPSARKTGNKDVVGSFVNNIDPSTSNEKTKEMELKRSRVDNRDKQGRNSLAQLCRRFLMVLLSNPNNQRVSLDVASTVLIKDPETEGFEPPSRSRCRRLYDIANVLVALGLIRKVHYLFGTKKIPLFVYCGPEPDETTTFDVFSSVEKLLRNPTNTPQTPTIKATTDKIVQSIAGFGKRTHSDGQLDVAEKLKSSVKMQKVKSEQIPPQSPNALMLFAAVAEQQLRMEMAAKLNELMPSTSDNSTTFSTITTTSASLPTTPLLQKPVVQKPLANYPLPVTQISSKFDINNYIQTFSPTSNLRPFTSQLSFSSSKPTGRSPAKRSIQPLFDAFAPPQMSIHLPSAPVKHSMSNILGSSTTNKQSVFDHTTTSPFQVVQKNARPK